MIDPETVHDRTISFGKFLGSNRFLIKTTSLFFDYKNSSLEQDILGMHFVNPIGLAAGFDKNAELTQIIPAVGFGFEEVGSITGEPCQGNPKPRLWRLPKSKALVVYYGLKNKGCEVIARELRNKKFSIIIGTSIAKTNSPETVDISAGIKDYVKAFKFFADIGDYFTINISCPNVFCDEDFSNPQNLDLLLSKIDEVPTQKPIFLKLSADTNEKQVDEILEVIKKHKVHGFVCSNLTKKRDGLKLLEPCPFKGGISGKAVEQLSNNLISYIYKKTAGKYIIIGLGGVFSAEDAYKKIKLGASLVQLITGMIFEGPQLISEINQGLVYLLKKDGFKNISQAVGIDNR
jgi:dihydroorotate dehydrogenase